MDALKYNIIHVQHLIGKEREATLAAIKDSLKINKDNIEVLRYLVESNLVTVLTEVIKEHDDWVHSPPDWVYGIVYYNYVTKSLQVPVQQTTALLEAVVEKLGLCTSYVEVWNNCLHSMCNNMKGEAVISNTTFYNTLKSILISTKSEEGMKRGILSALTALTDGNAAWQKKVLGDKPLTQEIVGLHKVFSQDYYFWGLMLNISQHEDAKTLLPKEVAMLAKEGTHELCPDIYAILCEEETATELKINNAYLEDKVKKIRNLLKSKHITESTISEDISFNLLDLLRPLANLSIGDGNKVMLGRVGLVKLLLDVLQIDEKEILSDFVKKQLTQSKITASEALWNLAFNTTVRQDIVDHEGIAICNRILEKMGSSLLRKNLSGIIYMCSGSTVGSPVTTVARHIMISYQWAAQDIVKNITTRLRNEGYRVWLDLDEMRGSILDSMALAIESAEVVLMCVSQKYKDSANCKFEAQYAAKRKVPIIPLKMQPDYDPDGWLGIILGCDLWYACHDELALESSFAKLIAALGNRGKAPPPPRGRAPSPYPPLDSSLPISYYSSPSGPFPFTHSHSAPDLSTPPEITVSSSPSAPAIDISASSAFTAVPPRATSDLSPSGNTSHPYVSLGRRASPVLFADPSPLAQSSVSAPPSDRSSNANTPPVHPSTLPGPNPPVVHPTPHHPSANPPLVHPNAHPPVNPAHRSANPPHPSANPPLGNPFVHPPPTYVPYVSVPPANIHPNYVNPNNVNPYYVNPAYVHPAYTWAYGYPSFDPAAFVPPPPFAHTPSPYGPPSSTHLPPSPSLPLKDQFRQTADVVTKKIQVLQHSLAYSQDPNEINKICAALKECLSVLSILNQ